MKTKSKENKKLALNKISIAWLDKDIFKWAKGGDVVTESVKVACPDKTVTAYPPQCPSVTHYICNTDGEVC